jgi:hypothetical protein
MVQQPSSTDRALAQLERERKQESDEKSTVWAFIWTLFTFKIVTVGLIFYAAAGTHESFRVLLATTWFWFLIPAFAIAGPLLFRWRLIKQRRKRESLRQSEWSDDGQRVAPLDPKTIQLIIHPEGTTPGSSEQG